MGYNADSSLFTYGFIINVAHIKVLNPVLLFDLKDRLFIQDRAMNNMFSLYKIITNGEASMLPHLELKEEQGINGERATNTQPLMKPLSLSAQLENDHYWAAQQKPLVLKFLPTRNHTNVCIKEKKSIYFSFASESGINKLFQRI